MGALPDNYEAPKIGGSYMKFVQGANKFRILSKIITGWEGWDKSGDKPKPVRSKNREDLRDYETVKDRIQYFWAMVVWNYNDKQLEVLAIKQATIQGSLQELDNSDEWGDLRGYDITVKRVGEALETSYTVIPSPIKPIDPEIKKEFLSKKIRLEALFTGENPFDVTESIDPDEVEVEMKKSKKDDSIIDTDSLPF